MTDKTRQQAIDEIRAELKEIKFLLNHIDALADMLAKGEITTDDLLKQSSQNYQEMLRIHEAFKE